jgi:hypothetical protein
MEVITYANHSIVSVRVSSGVTHQMLIIDRGALSSVPSGMTVPQPDGTRLIEVRETVMFEQDRFSRAEPESPAFGEKRFQPRREAGHTEIIGKRFAALSLSASSASSSAGRPGVPELVGIPDTAENRPGDPIQPR